MLIGSVQRMPLGRLVGSAEDNAELGTKSMFPSRSWVSPVGLHLAGVASYTRLSTNDVAG
jgi:hypothetical protein